MTLPGFVPPMLAKTGREPFSSDDYLFEIKWDGTRALAFVEGGDYRLAWLACHDSPEAQTAGFQNALARVDVSTGDATVFRVGEEQYPGEPVFVPRPGGDAEDDGWVLTMVYDATTDESHVAVLDARDPEKGPICRAFMGHRVPPGFHGAFFPARGS